MLKMASVGLLALVLAPVAGASTVPGPVVASENLVTIEKAMSGPYTQRAFVIANSAAEWDAAMDTLEAAGALQVTPPPPAPTGVDWQQEVVVLVSAGFTGYDVTLALADQSTTVATLGATWTPLGNDASWAMPYHLARTSKLAWLRTQVVVGDRVDAVLPLSGNPSVATAAGSASWGQVKALYHQ